MNKTKESLQLLGIQHPIIQGGMVWCSGWELASAVSNCGGLGVIGAASMYPDVLQVHIKKCKQATNNPFAVNLPLLYPNIEEHIESIIELDVPIVITSAGNPNTWTKTLKDAGKKVIHVVSSAKFALKAQAAGVDMVVAEGFEAGGHNGREETTTMCLVPEVKKVLEIPLYAAGGIGSGKSMLAAMALGADGVQMGSRFIMTEESSAHLAFKQAIAEAKEGDTLLTLKEIGSVRLLKNPFFQQIVEAYQNQATVDELKELLGRGRAKKGMFLGDRVEGELEVGQIAASLGQIQTVQEVMNEVLSEFKRLKKEVGAFGYT